MQSALTIAGSDSGGGAGIQADLKTFAAHGVFGTSAVTAVTAQNTLGVTAVEVLPAAIVVAQIDAVASDLRPAATKMGMLASVDIVRATAVAIARHRLPNIVLDTVMVAKGGARLISDAAVAAMREQLLPLADLVTPNVPEAEALTGLTIRSVDDMRLAARQIADLGAKAVLLKGGHLEGAATDVLLTAGRIVELSASRIDTRHTHGTGCTLSAAIAARLALGDGLEDAVRAAKQYVTVAIRQAPSLGAGHGPLQHFPKLP
jgi:hydroxymethylpyrimidine/phosphomethylpyrimidine kinase